MVADKGEEVEGRTGRGERGVGKGEWDREGR